MTGAPTLADRARGLDFVDGKALAICCFGLGLVPDSCWRLGGTIARRACARAVLEAATIECLGVAGQRVGDGYILPWLPFRADSILSGPVWPLGPGCTLVMAIFVGGVLSTPELSRRISIAQPIVIHEAASVVLLQGLLAVLRHALGHGFGLPGEAFLALLVTPACAVRIEYGFFLGLLSRSNPESLVGNASFFLAGGGGGAELALLASTLLVP